MSERFVINDTPTYSDVELAKRLLLRNLEILHDCPESATKERQKLRRLINDLEAELFRQEHHEQT